MVIMIRRRGVIAGIGSWAGTAMSRMEGCHEAAHNAVMAVAASISDAGSCQPWDAAFSVSAREMATSEPRPAKEATANR